jgi:hypothetical protein
MIYQKGVDVLFDRIEIGFAAHNSVLERLRHILPTDGGFSLSSVLKYDVKFIEIYDFLEDVTISRTEDFYEYLMATATEQEIITMVLYAIDRTVENRNKKEQNKGKVK